MEALACPVFRAVRMLDPRAVAWRSSYSIGVSIPSDECRRCRLWKISRYSKIALASSITGPPPLPVQQFDLHPGPERLDDGIVEAVTDRAHGGEQPRVEGTLGERPRK